MNRLLRHRDWFYIGLGWLGAAVVALERFS